MSSKWDRFQPPDDYDDEICTCDDCRRRQEEFDKVLDDIINKNRDTLIALGKV